MITLPSLSRHSAAPPDDWQWPILGPLLRAALKPIPNIPVGEWAAAKVFLSRKITSKPGYYDPDEFGWTWEWQDIVRTRAVWTAPQPDGAVIVVPEGTPGATRLPVSRVTAMKSSVSGFTEGVLNSIRWIAENDPQNVIYAIDSAKSAADINENRLQPTLRQLGQDIFTGEDDDVKRFLLALSRMLIYFLGSYSEAAFAYKFCELAVGDEVEEHGNENSIENLESRLKSALRPLLYLLSKPKLEGGRIAAEYGKGTMFVYEIPCPTCGFYQQLLQDNMKFDHCKNLLGEWEFARMAQETHFQCLNPDCRRQIGESWKRWFNDRRRRRWRQTNFNPEPGHVSFHMSDFYGYHPDATWPKLAVKYVQSKGDPIARQAYRNHHEGLPWEVRATKTEVDDILALRGTYRRGTIPWKPFVVVLAADIGLAYIKWSVSAFRRDGEMAVVDWGEGMHPDDLLKVLAEKKYPCIEDTKPYRIQLGFSDAKYRKEETHGACRKSKRLLWPVAGINADLTTRSISLNKIPGQPDWFGLIVFVDRDAKSELYEHRITEWVDWESRGKQLPADDPKRHPPDYARIWFPADLRKDDDFLVEHTKERLVELTTKDKGWMPHAAKQFIWKRKGANHWGDCTKIAIVGYRYLTRAHQS